MLPLQYNIFRWEILPSPPPVTHQFFFLTKLPPISLDNVLVDNFVYQTQAFRSSQFTVKTSGPVSKPGWSGLYSRATIYFFSVSHFLVCSLSHFVPLLSWDADRRPNGVSPIDYFIKIS